MVLIKSRYWRRVFVSGAWDRGKGRSSCKNIFIVAVWLMGGSCREHSFLVVLLLWEQALGWLRTVQTIIANDSVQCVFWIEWEARCSHGAVVATILSLQLPSWLANFIKW
jgi:hypothetical protein